MMSVLLLSMGCCGPSARTRLYADDASVRLNCTDASSIAARAQAGLLLCPNAKNVAAHNPATHYLIAHPNPLLQPSVAEWSARGLHEQTALHTLGR